MKKLRDIVTWIRVDRRRLIATCVGIILLVFGVWRFLSGKGNGKVQYQTAKVEKGTIVATVSASGTILTANILTITTSATGIVKKVYVSDGQNVYKGQKLAEIELDSEGARANASAFASYQSAATSVQSARNGLRSAQASVEKVLDDVKGHDTDETLIQKETRTKAEVAKDNAYDAAKLAEVRLISSALDYQASSPVVVAPNSGTIENISVVEGMTLSSSSTDTSSGKRIAVIKSEGTPLATFNFSEIDVAKIKQGQKATITLDSILDKTFTGKVVSVDKLGSVSSGVTTYPVIIKFDTQAPEILPNMAASASIILDTKNGVLFIPSSAVTTSGDQSIVKVLKDSKEQNINVETGLSSDTQIEIVSGLTEGEEVITGTVSTSAQTQQTRSVFGGFGGGGVRMQR